MSEPEDGGAPRSLDAAIDRLPRELDPERDLWPEIAAGLPQAGRERPWAMRFAGVAVIAAAAVIGWQVATRPPAPEVPFAVEMPASEGRGPAQSAAGLPVEFVAAEASLLALRDQRYGDLEARLDALPREQREAIERSLGTIAIAVAELRQALAQAPVDPVLQHLLWSLYTQELAVLGQLDQATRLAGTEGIEL